MFDRGLQSVLRRRSAVRNRLIDGDAQDRVEGRPASANAIYAEIRRSQTQALQDAIDQAALAPFTGASHP